MASGMPGPDPLDTLVGQTLCRLSQGEPPCRLEVERVDIKEEPDRRGPGGAVSPGERTNDEAARCLAGEMACMANSPGGGALIVGVANDGARIGTRLDKGWLRHRIRDQGSGSPGCKIDRCST